MWGGLRGAAKEKLLSAMSSTTWDCRARSSEASDTLWDASVWATSAIPGTQTHSSFVPSSHMLVDVRQLKHGFRAARKIPPVWTDAVTGTSLTCTHRNDTWTYPYLEKTTIYGLLLGDMGGDLWVQGGLGRDMMACSNMMHTGNSLNLGNIGGAIRGY